MYVDAALHRVAIPLVGTATMVLDPRPLRAITMGDPAGIGPVVVLKALRHPGVYARLRPMVIGDRSAAKGGR